MTECKFYGFILYITLNNYKTVFELTPLGLNNTFRSN